MTPNADDTRLQDTDKIVKADWGGYVVHRNAEFSICRCRECNDNCDRLAQPPHTLCVHCHNNHTQQVGGNYKGPFIGPRDPILADCKACDKLVAARCIRSGHHKCDKSRDDCPYQPEPS